MGRLFRQTESCRETGGFVLCADNPKYSVVKDNTDYPVRLGYSIPSFGTLILLGVNNNAGRTILDNGQPPEKIRKARKLTQEQLSDFSGVSIRHIAKIEKGQINPSFEILSALVEALGTTYDAILLNPTSSQEESDIHELIGLYKACPEAKRHWILSAVHFIVNELYNENNSEK